MAEAHAIYFVADEDLRGRNILQFQLLREKCSPPALICLLMLLFSFAFTQFLVFLRV